MSASNPESGDQPASTNVLSVLGTTHGKYVHSRRVKVLVDHFVRLIPHGHRVLDVGCGDGMIARMIMDARPDIDIVGTDILVRGQTRIPVTEFDGHQLPFGDKVFDTALFCDVLHHADSVTDLLREATRVVRKSVLIKDHLLQGPLASWTLRFMDYVGNAPHGVVLPYHYLTPREWEDEFRKAGLRVQQEIRNVGLYPWWANWLFGRSLHFIGTLDVLAKAGND